MLSPTLSMLRERLLLLWTSSTLSSDKARPSTDSVVKQLQLWSVQGSKSWGIPTQQKSQTAENENSVPFSRIFLYAAIWLAEISNRIKFTMMKTRVRFCRNYYYNVVRYVHIPLVLGPFDEKNMFQFERTFFTFRGGLLFFSCWSCISHHHQQCHQFHRFTSWSADLFCFVQASRKLHKT